MRHYLGECEACCSISHRGHVVSLGSRAYNSIADIQIDNVFGNRVIIAFIHSCHLLHRLLEVRESMRNGGCIPLSPPHIPILVRRKTSLRDMKRTNDH